MHILMLAQFYPPITGGEEHHVRDLAGELAARGHTVSVATLWHAGDPAFAIEHGVRVYRIRGLAQYVPGLFTESGRRHTPPFPDPGLVWSLRQIVTRERPEIVHAHNWIVHSFLPLKAWSGAKLVMTLHDFSLTCPVKTLMYKDCVCPGPSLNCLRHASEQYGLPKGVPITIANWAMSAFERASVDMFLAVSEAVVSGNRLDRGRVPHKVIPNFLSDELPLAVDCHDYLNKLPDEPFFLFAGDLRVAKGINELLNAYKDLATIFGPHVLPLVLIGRVLDETPKHLPSSVLMLGKWPHQAVMAAFPRSVAVLMPSTWAEPFGISAMEAAASGRPVIASRIGGLPDIVADGETGFLVPPGDPDALREAMRRILEDPNLAMQMGCAGKARAERFRARNIVPLIEQVYEEVLIQNHAEGS